LKRRAGRAERKLPDRRPSPIKLFSQSPFSLTCSSAATFSRSVIASISPTLTGAEEETQAKRKKERERERAPPKEHDDEHTEHERDRTKESVSEKTSSKENGNNSLFSSLSLSLLFFRKPSLDPFAGGSAQGDGFHRPMRGLTGTSLPSTSAASTMPPPAWAPSRSRLRAFTTTQQHWRRSSTVTMSLSSSSSSSSGGNSQPSPHNSGGSSGHGVSGSGGGRRKKRPGEMGKKREIEEEGVKNLSSLIFHFFFFLNPSLFTPSEISTSSSSFLSLSLTARRRCTPPPTSLSSPNQQNTPPRPLRGPRRDPAPALPGPARPAPGHAQRRPHRDRREGLRRPAVGPQVSAREGAVRPGGAGGRGRVAREVPRGPVSQPARGEVKEGRGPKVKYQRAEVFDSLEASESAASAAAAASGSTRTASPPPPGGSGRHDRERERTEWQGEIGRRERPTSFFLFFVFLVFDFFFKSWRKRQGKEKS